MRPGNESELAEALRQANGPLLVRGGGTRGFGRSAAGEVLETGGLSGIALYEPGALTLVAGAGTPLAEVEAVLAAERQRLAFEVPDMRGLLGRSGRLDHRAGWWRPMPRARAGCRRGPAATACSGCGSSMAAGTVVKNGGRVMKNVTGYDLVKLMAGSRGTLGVLTEVSFKVQARARDARRRWCCRGWTTPRAWPRWRGRWARPSMCRGRPHLPGEGTLLRIEGMAGSVAYRAGQLAALVGGDVAGGGRQSARAVARDARCGCRFTGRPGDVWRLSVTPTAAPGIVARAGARRCCRTGAAG